MTQLIVSNIITIVSLFFFGWTFALVEKNEDLDTKEEEIRNNQWHKTKAFAIGFFLLNGSYLFFGVTLAGVLYWLAGLCLIVLIFNPSINLFKGNGFFYLSSDPSTFEHRFADKLWKRLLYYCGALIIYLGLTYLLIKKYIL